MDVTREEGQMFTLKEAQTWRDEAIADGWSHSPIYKHEAEDTACHLEREGFVASVYVRNERGCHVCVWGPDTLAIEPPNPYDWNLVVYRTHICAYCGNYFDKTVRIGFAGRCCPECRKKHLAEVEYPGWTN